MPRKTREQKIIADLRRQLKLREAITGVEAPVTPVSTPSVKISAPKVATERTDAVGHPYLKRDLLRVGLVVALGIILESAITILANSGTLKSLGFS